jgi:arylsulfatase A-like enzyme
MSWRQETGCGIVGGSRTRSKAIVLFWAALAAALSGMARAAEPPYNVLFIAIDDLRPQLHCYGHDEMSTPNIDRLASQGRLFERQYVQVPTCGASRCALLTGRYPTVPAAYDNDAFATLPRERATAVMTMPELFHEHGYQTVSLGKISHNPAGVRPDGEAELAFGWDETSMPAGKWGTPWNAFFGYADGSTRTPGQSPSTEHADVGDEGYPDGLLADAAVEKLRALKGRPFFLAVGFIKPHLPFNAPERYWDLYGCDQIPAAKWERPPRGVDPAISLHKSSELTPRYTGLATPGVVTAEEGCQLRHAYAACVSYVDAQVGKVLAELERLGLADNTIVVLWGDHGWHLGEHGIWGKHTLHEVALRSPLVVRVPKMASPGVATSGLVEAVDIFPTLAGLCELGPVTGVDGASFAPLLADPGAAGKPAAYGFWSAGRGHSIRTDRYRLTQYTERGAPGRLAQVELYDHQSDPEETDNIAAMHPEIVRDLSTKLREHVPMLRDRRRPGSGGK